MAAHRPAAASVTPVPPQAGHSGHPKPQCKPARCWGCTHVPSGRGCAVGPQPGWGLRRLDLHLQAGMRGQAGTSDWQCPGGGPRRLAPFPSDPGSSAASTCPATAPPEALAASEAQGCSGRGDALTGTCLPPAAPAPAPPCTGVLSSANWGVPGRGLQARVAGTVRARPHSSPLVPNLSARPEWAGQVLLRSELKIDQERVGAPMPGSLPQALSPRCSAMAAAPARVRMQRQQGATASAPHVQEHVPVTDP